MLNAGGHTTLLYCTCYSNENPKAPPSECPKAYKCPIICKRPKVRIECSPKAPLNISDTPFMLCVVEP